MTVVSIPLMDKTGRRTLHLYGLGGMFIFSIFITISFLIKASAPASSKLAVVCLRDLYYKSYVILNFTVKNLHAFCLLALLWKGK